MARRTLHTADTAPEAARPALQAAQQSAGFLSNLLAVLANAPVALEAYQTLSAINARASLSLPEREVVQLIAATTHGCGFCVAGHTALGLNKAKLPAAVVDAIVRAQLWTRDHRAETARLLSKEGPNRYTPHPIEALNKVLAPPASDRAGYVASGVIHHPEWDEKRIDFQPYPYPSYTEALVEKLKHTVIEADRGFLAELDPALAARDLVDDRYVKRAIESVGGLSKFGGADSYTRMETISA